MYELKTTERNLWTSFLEDLVLEEYTEGMIPLPKEKAPDGAPFIVCPDRVFSTTSERRGRNVDNNEWGNIDFADPKLIFVSFLVWHGVIGYQDAIDLYEDDLDLHRPASEVLEFPVPMYVVSEEGTFPLDVDQTPLWEVLGWIREDMVHVEEDGRLVLWNESEDFEHRWEMMDWLERALDGYRLHRIEIHPKADHHPGIATEYYSALDATVIIGDYLWTDEERELAYYPGEEDALSVHHAYAYKGGGFSCTR